MYIHNQPYNERLIQQESNNIAQQMLANGKITEEELQKILSDLQSSTSIIKDQNK